MKQRKDAYYFPHDCNAKDDPKCMLLIEQLGLEGYGTFWVLVETLREQPDFKYPLKLIPALARRYNTTAEKMKTVVMSYGLFNIDEGSFFFSESLNRRMQLYIDKKRTLSEAGKKGNEIRWRNSIALRSGSDKVVIANKINKIKTNETLFFEEMEEVDLLKKGIPPNDGADRNWIGLQEHLMKMNPTREQANEIIRLSNFGEKNTLIWKLIMNVRNSNGAIKQPILFLLKRLKDK